MQGEEGVQALPSVCFWPDPARQRSTVQPSILSMLQMMIRGWQAAPPGAQRELPTAAVPAVAASQQGLRHSSDALSLTGMHRLSGET